MPDFSEHHRGIAAGRTISFQISFELECGVRVGEHGDLGRVAVVGTLRGVVVDVSQIGRRTARVFSVCRSVFGGLLVAAGYGRPLRCSINRLYHPPL